MNKQQNIPQSAGIRYRILRIANDQYGVAPSEMSPEQKRSAQSIAAKEVVMEQAVLSSREAREVVVPQSQIKIAISQIRDRFENREDFEVALEHNGLTLQELESAVGRELLVEAVLTYVSSRVETVDDTEVRLFYYMHPEKFTQPEIRLARHILITINPDFPENVREKAFERASQIAERVKKDPRRFEEQALKHSECPTSFQGGQLGQIKKGTLFPELDSALFQMDEGEISDVIESPLGFHVLWCEQVDPERSVPLIEIQENLREKLTQRKRSKFQRGWLKEKLQHAGEEHTKETEDSCDGR